MAKFHDTKNRNEKPGFIQKMVKKGASYRERSRLKSLRPVNSDNYCVFYSALSFFILLYLCFFNFKLFCLFRFRRGKSDL